MFNPNAGHHGGQTSARRLEHSKFTRAVEFGILVLAPDIFLPASNGATNVGNAAGLASRGGTSFVYNPTEFAAAKIANEVARALLNRGDERELPEEVRDAIQTGNRRAMIEIARRELKDNEFSSDSDYNKTSRGIDYALKGFIICALLKAIFPQFATLNAADASENDDGESILTIFQDGSVLRLIEHKNALQNQNPHKKIWKSGCWPFGNTEKEIKDYEKSLQPQTKEQTVQPDSTDAATRASRSSGVSAVVVHDISRDDVNVQTSKSAEHPHSKQGLTPHSDAAVPSMAASSAKKASDDSRMRMSDQELQEFLRFQRLKAEDSLRGQRSAFNHYGGMFSTLHPGPSYQSDMMLTNRRISASMAAGPSSHNGLGGLDGGYSSVSNLQSMPPPSPSFFNSSQLPQHSNMPSPMSIPQNGFNAHIPPPDYRGHGGLRGGYDALNHSGMPSSASYGETSYDQGITPMRFPQNSGNLPRVPSSSQSSSSSDSLKPPPYPPPSVTPPIIIGNVHYLNDGRDTPGTNSKRQRY